MADPFIDDYVAKLALLEKAIGHKTSYRILEPFVLPGLGMAEPVEIQRAAKRIADFVGLGSKTFLIAADTFESNNRRPYRVGLALF